MDQEKTFIFFLVTHNSITLHEFEFGIPGHILHAKILNTVCGWKKLNDWVDVGYEYHIGKVVKFTLGIKEQLDVLQNEFEFEKDYSFKESIKSLCEIFSDLKFGDLFFVYRVVYDLPKPKLLYKVLNELSYIKKGRTKQEADDWFSLNATSFFDNYELNIYSSGRIGEKDKNNRVCRFCGRKIQKEHVAHIIPASIGGDKHLVSLEECTECNHKFGETIEQNLCNWFDYRRSVYCKNKNDSYGKNYYVKDKKIYAHENVLHSKKILGSKKVTLQGIYRAFCKMAIDLIDREYLDRLNTTIEWVRYGQPKSTKYPKIAQMYNLPLQERPIFFICTRKDGLDGDSPLHFCIFLIFDLAFLFAIPHVDGRMFYPENYMDNIPLNVFNLFGLNQNWEWESYDTTQYRLPHVNIDIK